MSDGSYYLVYGGVQQKGRQIKDAYGKYVEKQEFSSYDDKFAFKPTDKGWTVTGPTDPGKDGSYSGPITTRPQDESTLIQRMGFDRQATRLGFKGVQVAEVEGGSKTPAPDMKKIAAMNKELQNVEIMRSRGRIWIKSLDKYFESNDESTAYEKAVEAIKAKYKTKK